MDDLNQAKEFEILDGPPTEETIADGEQSTPTTPEAEAPPEVETTEEPTVVAEETTSDEGAIEETTEGASEKETPAEPEDFSTQLGKLSDGQLTSFDDINSLISDNSRLKSEAENTKPKFDSEQSKNVYELLTQHPGLEYDKVIQWAHVHKLSNNFESLSDKDKLFEAFALKDEYLSIPREDLKDAWGEIYDDKYGDETKSSQLRLKTDLAGAEKTIRDKSDQYGEFISEQQNTKDVLTTQEKEDRLTQVTEGVEESLPGFEKLTFKFGENEKEHFNFDIKDDREAFKEALVDPVTYLSNFINSFIADDKSFDYNSYVAEMSKIFYRDQMNESLFNHGTVVGDLRRIKVLKNPSTPEIKSAPEVDKKDYWGKVADALNQARGK